MGFLKDFGASLKKQLGGVQVKYIGGHPDAPFHGNVTVIREEDYITFLALEKPKIPISSIKKVELEKASKRSAGKAAAGAIIGGALTGGVGLIAGAAIGGRKRDDSILVVTVDYNGMEVEMVFGGDNITGKYNQFMGLLR